MSVLIKGMEMPTSCDECRLSVDDGCVPQNQWLNEEGTNKRLDNCPLIELPPHGRLIDADALWDKGWFLTRDNIYKGQIESAILTMAPTILEAEVDE